jgi:soluble lytic murein transglycosylase-like protein
MSGSIFEREKLRPTAAPFQAVGNPGRPNERAAPVRPGPRVAPNRANLPERPGLSDDLLALGTALSGLSPVLQGIATDYFKGVRQEEAGAADMDATKASLENVASWSDAVRLNPALADKSPFYRQIYEERLARQTITRKGNELHAEYWNSEIAGSEDPAAIQGWMTERLKPVLEAYKDNPAARAAAAEEVRGQAQSLTRTHQANAVKNLVTKNEDSFSAAVSSVFDTYGARGGAAEADVQFAVPDHLKSIYAKVAEEEGMPVQLLLAQGHRESGFRPDVISGKVRSSAGAIGIAQVLPSTARDPGYGLSPISEQDLLDPEKAIRFQAKYLKARGAALGVKDWQDPAQAAKGLAAYGGPGEEARGYSSGILSMANLGRAAPSGPGGGGSIAGLAAQLEQLAAGARAQGVDQHKVNQLMTQAVTAAMIRHGRSDFGELGLMPRGDGSPGFAATAEGRHQIEQARNALLSRSVQEENVAHTRFMRQRSIASDALTAEVSRNLIDQLAEGKPPQLTPDQLRLATRIDPGLVSTLTGVQNSLRGVASQEDPEAVARLELEVNYGTVPPREVLAQWGGVIKDPATLRRLQERALEAQSSDNLVRNSMVQQVIRSTVEAAAGMEASGVLKNHGKGVAVQQAMWAEVARIQQEDPKASQAVILERLDKLSTQLINRFNPDANVEGYKARAGSENAPDPEAQSTAPIPVDPTFNWRRQPAPQFKSLADLETAYQAFVSGNFTPDNPVVQWVLQGKVNPTTFYDNQKRLLSKPTR